MLGEREVVENYIKPWSLDPLEVCLSIASSMSTISVWLNISVLNLEILTDSNKDQTTQRIFLL